MKKLILYISLLLFAYTSFSQALRVERSDVDIDRSGHITANHTFGMDIYIDEIENVNSVSFQLRWNFGDYVHFSGYKSGEFGDNGTVFISKEKYVPGTQNKFINLGIFSGTTIGENEFDSPKVIHLTFTVSYNVPDREELTFNFINMFATAFSEGSQQNIEIATEPLIYNVHGFVDVWPGDANNDGLVDTRDYNQIGLFFAGNSISNKSRSFKRENASIKWIGQKVLVWDNGNATYADCDGDGVITVADGMVVFHNDTKTHNQGTGLPDEETETGLASPDNSISNGNVSKIPIFVDVYDSYKAFTGKVEIPQDVKFIGLEKGSLFESVYAPIIKQIDKNELEFTIGTFDEQFVVSKPGVIANILVEKDIFNDNAKAVIPYDAQIIDKSGRYITANTLTTSVERLNKETLKLIQTNEYLKIESQELIEGVDIFNMQGQLIKSKFSNSKNIQMEIDFQPGIYLVKIHKNSPEVVKIAITN